MVKIGEVFPPLYNVVNELTHGIEKFAPSPDWHTRVDANTAQRLLDLEGNSTFHTFQVWLEYVYSLLGTHISFELQLDEPIIPWGAAIIVLVLIHKRFPNSIFVLLTAFLFSINPLYVCIVYITYWLYLNRYSKPRYTAIKRPLCDDYLTYSPEHFNKIKDTATITYDYVLIGNDVSTLFTAALLSRVGYTCCVLQPASAPPVTVTLPPSPTSTNATPQPPLSLRSSRLGRPLRYLVRP